MLTIKVLGPKTCYTKKAAQHARVALNWLNPHTGYRLETVTDQDEIADYVTETPSLVINECVVCEGRIPAIGDIVTWGSDVMQDELEAAVRERLAAAEPVSVPLPAASF